MSPHAAAALAEAQDQVRHANQQTNTLSTITGAITTAGVGVLALGKLPLPAVVGGWCAMVMTGAAFLYLLTAVRPDTRGGPAGTHGIVRWASLRVDLLVDELTDGPDVGHTAGRVAHLSRLALRKFGGNRRAVDLLRAAVYTIAGTAVVTLLWSTFGPESVAVMGVVTGVEWTRSTWNAWWGCAHKSRGCANCFAETLAGRFESKNGRVWGKNAPRRLLGDDNWRQPERWNRAAAREQASDPGAQWTVFAGTMMDILEDHPQVGEARKRAAELFARTPHLTWLLLSKEPWNAHLLGYGDDWPTNVWLGTSVESQAWAIKRLPPLIESGARTLFVSAEPLVEAVDLRPWMQRPPANVCTRPTRGGGATDLDLHIVRQFAQSLRRFGGRRPAIDWVICGGESGNRDVTPMHPDWARSLRDQCVANGVHYWFKQWGEYLPVEIEDDPQMVGGRAYENPRGGRSALALRQRAPRGNHFLGGQYRPMTPGDRTTGGTVMLDDRWVAVAVGKKAAGDVLDGRQWHERPDNWPPARAGSVDR